MNKKEDFLKFFIKTKGCWVWKGSVFKAGYGRFHFKNKSLKAHRFSYEIYKGPIPCGLLVCHKCDNPICINPDHLFLGSPQDNMTDCKIKGRRTKLVGEKHGRVKLNEKKVLEIRKSNDLQKDLATRFNISRTLVYKIKRNKVWKHI